MAKLSRPALIPNFFSSQSDYFVVVLLSGIAGTIAGGVVSYFNIIINWILEYRIDFINYESPDEFLIQASLIVLSGSMMAGLGFWLTFRFAPEAEGSGIPHIEGALVGEHDIRWRRIIPVKFVAAILTIGSGMILGRGGPSIQLGGAIGRMIAGRANKYEHAQHILIAAGSAAGIAAAFNTPLAAILFVNEEMRRQFSYNFTSVKCVTLAVIAATVVMEYLNGQNAVLQIPHFETPPLSSLITFATLGMLFGIVGVYFNRWILATTSWFKNYHGSNLTRLVMTGALLGALFSFLHVTFPIFSGGSLPAIAEIFTTPAPWMMMFLIFALRMFGTITCFGSGAPGGIFAPILTLGTFLGLTYGVLIGDVAPHIPIDPGMYAVAGMGALIAASLRTPLTGVVLVVEISNNYQLILPTMVTCLGATFIAQAIGGQPLYASLLELKQKDWKL
ncbi:H(+)/Cl(-) exchange transporter ClcA [Vibrio sp. SCSIO 43137]|uniref:H(+)/Cl(-) exchange transporter ClcA n=1 Tax=Vibrio sp. SCSIO 43137 TaxID=3021011 RepID=UPI0023078F7F|nr:H(+)/Cl(-) exchange transporter ClcA [Vibrio sp. SCSIO 43137]WCE31491.1 H(+)/Cl(-) exchange transporter ClcA [Vibrio sp. SCSIO 43137]